MAALIKYFMSAAVIVPAVIVIAIFLGYTGHNDARMED